MKLSKKNVKKVIGELVASKGTNYKELALVLGVTPSSVSNWAGGRTLPRTGAWLDLLSVYDGEYTGAVTNRIAALVDGKDGGGPGDAVSGAVAESVEAGSVDLAAIATILYSYRQLTPQGRRTVAPLFV